MPITLFIGTKSSHQLLSGCCPSVARVDLPLDYRQNPPYCWVKITSSASVMGEAPVFIPWHCWVWQAACWQNALLSQHHRHSCHNCCLVCLSRHCISAAHRCPILIRLANFSIEIVMFILCMFPPYPPSPASLGNDLLARNITANRQDENGYQLHF